MVSRGLVVNIAVFPWITVFCVELFRLLWDQLLCSFICFSYTSFHILSIYLLPYTFHIPPSYLSCSSYTPSLCFSYTEFSVRLRQVPSDGHRLHSSDQSQQHYSLSTPGQSLVQRSMPCIAATNKNLFRNQLSAVEWVIDACLYIHAVLKVKV